MHSVPNPEFSGVIFEKKYYQRFPAVTLCKFWDQWHLHCLKLMVLLEKIIFQKRPRIGFTIEFMVCLNLCLLKSVFLFLFGDRKLLAHQLIMNCRLIISERSAPISQIIMRKILSDFSKRCVSPENVINIDKYFLKRLISMSAPLAQFLSPTPHPFLRLM